MATRRINGFPKTTTFRLMRLYVCARFRDDGARSATSIASFSVSICRPFEIDDLSDQVKENDSKRRARASSSSFTHFGLNYSFFLVVVFKNIRRWSVVLVKPPFYVTTKKTLRKKSSRTRRRRRTHHRKIYVFFFFFFFFFSQQRQNRKRRAHRASNKIIVENGDVNSALVFVL